MDIWLTLAGSLFFLFTEGFFSGSEIGIVSSDKMRLRHDAAKGSRGASASAKECWVQIPFCSIIQDGLDS